MIKRTIIFNEALHTYTDEDTNPYISVTTLIGKYIPPFNKEYWSKYKANQTGTTQQNILDNWKDITDIACDKGNKEHKLLEDSINDSIKPREDFKVPKENLLVTALNKLSGHEFTNVNLDILAQSNLAKKYSEIFDYLRIKILEGFKLYVEKRTYSYEHLVAGTIDCLLVKGKDFIIVDWKTNKKELYFKSGYYRKVNGIESTEWVDKKDYLLAPLTHIENCKGNTYTLQLSLYAYILELWGMNCIGLILYHLREGSKPKPYNILYDKMSCELLMIDRKNRLTTISNNSNSLKNGNIFGIS